MRATRLGGSVLAIALLGAGGCGDGDSGGKPTPTVLPPTVGNALRVTGASPYPAGCAPASGIYLGAEVEAHVAVDPTDPQHLVGAFQQDRSSGGGALGLRTAVSRDGGATWALGQAAFSRCSGGTAANGGDYDRATDPWVAFSPDGTVHHVGFSLDVTTHRQAIIASRSVDGGLTWSTPVAVATAATADLGLDKPTITADPLDPRRVYATWDRLTAVNNPDQTQVTGPAWFARSVDGGVSWQTPAVIFDPGKDEQTIGNIIVVLPDGTLVDVFTWVTSTSSTSPGTTIAATRSTDGGDHWSTPVVVSGFAAALIVPPGTGRGIRDGSLLFTTAVDAANAKVWVAWEDAGFSSGARNGIALASSADGGLTWSTPVQVNQDPSVQAFTPAVAVGPSGEVAVTYYDLRGATLQNTWTTLWLATSKDGGATFTERAAGERFELRAAPIVGNAFFLGDYSGLAAAGEGAFAPFFVMTNEGESQNPTDVFAARVLSP